MKIKKILACTLLIFFSSFVVADMQSDLADVQHQWAVAKYETPEDQQEQVFESLIIKARKLVEKYPQAAEPKVWLAIAISTDAGVNGGLGALGKVKKAKAYLENAEKIDPTVMNGSVYTSLGSLYYQVPGWPIGFGNDDKAEKYLLKALQQNPNGIDSNYFYADFLLEEDKPELAMKYLERAKAAAPRVDRPLADKGRHMEIDLAIAKARAMLD
jgi:tetratricopeptide (TPR) repeat protein